MNSLRHIRWQRLASFGFFLVVLVPVTLSAQSYSVLYTFKSGGSNPQAALIGDKAGNLYGTTNLGVGPNGYGTVFVLSSAGTLKTLHTFSGDADGRYPDARLVRDRAGNLYGTTSEGGNLRSGCNPGCGVVYKIDTARQFHVLYSFTGGTDGMFPDAELILDTAGNLYGTTYEGGNTTSAACVQLNGCGVVFKVDSAGNESVLYAFSGGTDGGFPAAGLLMDAAGNLYGTTSGGGNATCSAGCGVIFMIDSAGNYSVLYSFVGGTFGYLPTSTLIRDDVGILYGTTSQGGDVNCHALYGAGCGTIFRLDTAGTLTVLHSFSGGNDGAFPNGLSMDSASNLYGTTEYGGNSACVQVFSGCGTIFKLDSGGNETILYSFQGSEYSDGYHPMAGLYIDSVGNLYGTTEMSKVGTAGAVFKLIP